MENNKYVNAMYLKSDLARNNSKKTYWPGMCWRDYKTYKSDATKIKFTKIIIMKKAYLEIGEGAQQ